MNNSSLQTTDFHFPGQTGVYHGKVRDVYTIEDGRVILVASDRLSAFDVILPKTIPFKGQILNQLAAHFLARSGDIVPNWLLSVPDPNVSVGVRAEPIKMEVIVRGSLVGGAWREYSAGARSISGVGLPEGMKEFDRFDHPIITPSTKADQGHDENISAHEILNRGLATAVEWDLITDYALQLFARGQEMARARGLVLADTKYEFGRLGDKILLIDEIHTPDSSRYFYADGYDAYVSGTSTETPRQLSKEFVRQWLIENGFSGQPGETLPELTDEFIGTITDRYIELYEKMTGEVFVKADTYNIVDRIEKNVVAELRGKH